MSVCIYEEVTAKMFFFSFFVRGKQFEEGGAGNCQEFNFKRGAKNESAERQDSFADSCGALSSKGQGRTSRAPFRQAGASMKQFRRS